MERDRSIVECSVGRIDLLNDGQARHKVNLYVQNRYSAPRKVRVAVSKESDPVSDLQLSYEAIAASCILHGVVLFLISARLQLHAPNVHDTRLPMHNCTL